MAIHRDISPDLRGAAARVAMAALSEARGQQTAPNGTVSVRNADGTRTVIGAGAGTDETGAPVGVRQFVGDTTPPGRPTGLSWLSVDGTITGAWDGTLEGGVPADLSHVELLAGNLVVGRLRRAGSCSVAAEVGASYDCRAVAVDVSGNASAESAHVAVTCRDMAAEARGVADAANAAAAAAKAAADRAQSDVDGASKSIQETEAKAQAAKDAAAQAQSKAEGVASDLSATKATVEQHATELGELTTKVSNAATKADSALTASTEARQSATEATTKAESAYRDSQTALTQSTTATQTAAKAQTTAESAAETANDSLRQSSQATQTASEVSTRLTTEYQTKADADKKYATQASLKATSDSIASEVSKTYATKATVDALQNIADNAIESWRGSGVPTADNKPASDWTTAALKRQHNGDLYYDKSTGKAYRWGSDDGVTYTWELNQDSDVTKALQDASNAQASAEAAGTAASKAQDTADTATSKADAAQSSADTAKSAADSAASAASKAQGDVDKLKVDIPATYVTKSAFEQTSESITASVTKAQQTAGSAVTASAKAQQTADGISAELSKSYQTKAQADAAYATQASLKATSESLTASVSKAQGTADGAVTAASKAQQTADSVSLNLSKNYSTTADVNKKIDDISIGGRNILRLTKTLSVSSGTTGSMNEPLGCFSNNRLFSGDSNYDAEMHVRGGKVTSKLDAMEYDITNCKPGEIYTFSFKARSDKRTSLDVFFWGPGTYIGAKCIRLCNGAINHAIAYGDGHVVMNFTGKTEHFWVTYKLDPNHVATDKKILIRTDSTELGSTINVWAPKLELGNKSTDWTPAPEDLQPAGDYATKTELKATSDSITATVSKTYATREQLSQVEQTASGLTATIKSTVTGAKVEYALGTSSATPPTSGWSTTAPAWQSGRYMWQRTTVTKQDGTSSTSTTCIQGAKGETGATGAAGPQGPKGDDFDGDARLATIETLVRASGSGVEVAKKVNGAYTSTKTLMDDTGFSVLDKAGTVLSKFGNNLVQLGINSVSAIIEMCGGLLKISSRKDKNGSTFARMEAPSNGSGIELCCEGKAEDGGSVEVVSRVSRFVNRGGFNLSADYVNSDSSSPLNSVSVSGYADDNSSGASLSAKTITIDCSNLVVADLRNNVEMRGGQLVTEWAYLWRDGSDRFVRWCVRMGVCYLQAHRVNGVKSSGWKAGTLPASVRPDHSLWQPATPRHENNTAQMWVGGTEESDGGGPVWLYNNGSDDVFGIMSWPIG